MIAGGYQEMDLEKCKILPQAVQTLSIVQHDREFRFYLFDDVSDIISVYHMLYQKLTNTFLCKSDE